MHGDDIGEVGVNRIRGYVPYTGTLLALLVGVVGGVIPERRGGSALPAGERPDSLFQLGLRHYDENRLAEARWTFDGLARRLGQGSEWQGAAQLMLARTLYRLGDLPAAQDAASGLGQLPPPGVLPQQTMEQRRAYLPYANYLLAMISWRNHQRRVTVAHCYQVASAPDSPARLAEDARIVAQAVVAEADTNEFRAMDAGVLRFVRHAHQLNRAISLYHGGQLPAARMTLEALERSAPNGLYGQEIAALISEIRRAERTEFNIAVIAPLGGPDSAAGAEMVKGVIFALGRERTPLISRPVVRDVQTQIQTIKVVQELCDDPTVRAIIGPLTTANAIVAAAVANAHGVPLVTPTASGEGVSQIGPYIFQVNLTPVAQGRLLANVAMDKLRARTVATLSSVEPDDRAMADEFARVVREKGGEVFVQEWFFPNTSNMIPQLSRIRTAGLVRDTTVSEDIRRRLSLGQPTPLDTMRLMREVNTIDVLLVSSSNPRDIVYLAAQVPTQKIWARVLGGAVWGSQSVREQAGEDAEGVVFTTNFDPATPVAQSFVDGYRLEKREDPDIVTALSYDATALVIRAVSQGARTRTQVRDALANTRSFPGVTGTITFSSDGYNSEACVRTIRGGIVMPVVDWEHLANPRHWGVSAPAPVVEPPVPEQGQ